MSKKVIIESEMFVECSVCGSSLSAISVNDTIEVEPCTSCMETAYEDGRHDLDITTAEENYNRGYTDGFAEGKGSSDKADE